MPAAAPEAWRQEAVDLARTLGARGAAEEMRRRGRPVSKSALSDWSRQALGAAAGPPRPVATTTKPERPRAPAPATELEADPAGSIVEPSPAPPDSDALPPELQGVDPAALDFEALEELDRDVVAFRRVARADNAVRTYSALARLQLEVRLAMHKVRPTPPVDPETDPANVEAATLLTVRLAKLVAAAEKDKAPK